MLKRFFFIVLMLSGTISWSQNLYLNGVISGYNYNPTKHIFKKNSEILLDGRIEYVTLKVISNNKVISRKKTNKNGEFSLKIPTGKTYKIEASKTGYQSVVFYLDIERAKKDIKLPSLELILNSHIPKKYKESEPVGTLGFDNDGFYFEEIKSGGGLFSKEIDNKPLISLIEKSINKIKSTTYHGSKITPETEDSLMANENKESGLDIENSTIYANLIKKDQKGTDEESISEKEQTILDAKKQLEIDKQNAKTKLDSLLINERELLIVAAENELTQLKEIIKQKEEKIQLKNNQLYLFIGILILLVGLILFVLRSNKIKTSLNKELGTKNKKISDSISYAKKIQSAILSPKEDLLKLLPESFIIYKPKDQVSGDFYWFEEIDQKIIVAAVDCTGHGVPGAFMSMIGKTLMNNIIVEKKIFEPKIILTQLHDKLKKALNQNDADPFSSLDGMDLSICVIDKMTNKVSYAGAVNPIYLVKDGEVDVLKVNNRGVGGYDVYNDGEFVQYELKIEKGSNLYLLSDGYQDQFGGENGEKFNTNRFKDVLLSCENQPVKDQEKIMEDALKKWQSDNEQTDDILVMGISF